MKCLTICQPWAWAIVHGNKRIENRSWTTPYRGRLLIHAGKSKAYFNPKYEFKHPKNFDGWPPVHLLPFGAIVGVCTLVDCLPFMDCENKPYATGPYCWMLTAIQPLKTPLPYKGQQGLFDIPDNLLADLLHVTNPQPATTESK